MRRIPIHVRSWASSLYRRARPIPLILAIALLLSGATTQVARFTAGEPPVSAVNPFAAPPAADAGTIAPVAAPRSVLLSAPRSFRTVTRLSARIEPPAPGQFVAFQVRSGTAWRLIRSAPSDATGVASIAWRPAAAGMYTIRAATGSAPAAIAGGATNVAALAPAARIIRWREWIEPGIAGTESFSSDVSRIFVDARGWTASGRAFFVYQPAGPVDMVVKLATPKTTDRLCRPADTRGKWSCHANGSIVLNSDRWFKGSPTLTMPVAEYRAMVVNHETGHRLGFAHAGCGGRGAKAPVMMQQSKGLDGCIANPWPTPRELARL